MSTDNLDEMSLKVQEWLQDGPYACTSLNKLSGGTANFVYRGTLAAPLQDGSKTVVIKHTEGYVAQSPNFKLTTTRCVSCYTFQTLHAYQKTNMHRGLRTNSPCSTTQPLTIRPLKHHRPNTYPTYLLTSNQHTNLQRPSLFPRLESLCTQTRLFHYSFTMSPSRSRSRSLD